ncbi:MAG: hypothetical protein HPPSJP_2740 [Candidatus Hepatoplasma scabrum]|nr:MAG: hypothetical protein HPPSJP_2740 [Candidatus Hepatoplasma sp.]
MDTADALVLSLIIVSILAILVLVIVNIRLYLVKKKYSIKRQNTQNKNDSIQIEKNNQEQNKNSIINTEKNLQIDDFKSENDYFDYFNLMALDDLKKALIDLQIDYDQTLPKDQLIKLLLEELQNVENETKK